MTDQGTNEQRGVGEPQVDVPPYDELRGPPSEANREGVRRAFDASHAPPPDAGAPVSNEERGGTSSAETEPDPAHGVGASRRAGGEEQADEPEAGTQGAADRPVGRAGEGGVSGVDPKPATTPGAPDLPTGDQGG
jgi:hypothetical protein